MECTKPRRTTKACQAELRRDFDRQRYQKLRSTDRPFKRMAVWCARTTFFAQRAPTFGTRAVVEHCNRQGHVSPIADG